MKNFTRLFHKEKFIEKRANIPAIVAWCIYDWGIAAFPVIVTTFVFATYFTSHIAINEITGTQQWGHAIAIAGVIIAIFSPVFGAIADYSGRLKYWLGLFTMLLIISGTLLWYAYPQPSSINFTLICVVLGTVTYNLGMVFYNAMLPSLAPAHYVGRISGWGWALGYFGGLLALIIVFHAFVDSKPAWLNATTFENIRISGPFVAIYTAIFAIPLFFMVPDSPARLRFAPAINSGLKDLLSTLKNIRQQKTIFIFLIAQMIYMDGLNTLFAFTGIYAVGTFDMSLSEVLLFGIVMNACAGIGSLSLSWIDDWLSPKVTIMMCLFFLICLGLGIVLMHDKIWFWILGSMLSLFIGPVQSSSRALMSELTPKEKATQFFGFYVLSGKITTFIGPLILGTVTVLFNSQRAGMASILIFFIIGGWILCYVRTPKL